MDLDTSISIRDILAWLQTPIGRLVTQGFLVFVMCEAVRLFAEKWLDIQTKLRLPKVKLYAETISYACHFVFGFAVAVGIFYTKGWLSILGGSWWVIASSLFIHVAYNKYLSKKLSKKLGLTKQ